MPRYAPNLLTMLRIALVPLFWWLLFDGSQFLSLVVFWIAATTDFFDGWLARKRGLVSAFGKIADPIADKALTGAAWISLAILGAIAWPATIIILIREIGITVLRLIIVESTVVPASRGGKWKTTLQIVVISAYLLFPLPAPPPIVMLQTVLLWVTVIVTVATGIGYLQVMLPNLHKVRQ